jgi:hypothetical protein
VPLTNEGTASGVLHLAVSFDHCLVLSGCTDALRRKGQKARLYGPHDPLRAFLRSGGSACCLTLRLDHRSEEANLPVQGSRY